jgi:hypothetical protein
MQKEQMSSQSSFKPFFGGSDATAHFVAANYFTSNYKEPINTASNPNTLLGTVLENVMFVKNYDESSKAQGMKGAGHDNDIHNQFVDFIVRTALFHREFDRPTTVGSGLVAVHDSFTVATEQALNSKLGRSEILREELLNNMVPTDFELNESSTYFDYINLSLLILVDRLESANITSGETLSGVEIARHVMRNAIGNCLSDRKLCLLSLFDPNNAESSASQNIKNILNRLGSNILRSELMVKFETIAFEVLAEYALRLYQNLGGFVTIKGIFRESQDVVTRSVKALLTQTKNNDLKQALLSTLSDRFFDYISGLINRESFRQYNTLESNESARKLYENVFGNWDRLDGQARNFYRAHLHVFRKASASSGTAYEKSGWVDLMKNDEDFRPPVNAFPNELRLNLTHRSKGSKDTLFSYTLPFVPVSSVGSLWYTDSSGIVRAIPNGQLNVNILKTIYDCVYMETPCIIGENVINFPKSFNRMSDKDFNLDDVLIIRNFLKSQKNVTANVPVLGNKSPSFDDLYIEDMTTRVCYAVDENGDMYRDVNGQRVYVSDDTIRADNCMGTMLKGDQKQCSRFVWECILNTNDNDLSVCLDRLADENLFNVAQSEFENIHPDMAIKVLKAFGVGKKIEQNPTLGTIGVPENFDSWRMNFLSRINNPAQRAAIEKSVNFQRYVRGAIEFVRQHPVIMNRHLKTVKGANQNVQDMPEDPYLKALNKKYFINPYPQSYEGKLMNSQLLLRSVQTPVFAVTSPGNMVAPFPNVSTTIGAGSLVAPFGMMRGGGSGFEDTINRKINRGELSSDLMYNMFADVLNSLKNTGVIIDNVDKERIQNGIDQVKSIENRSFGLYNMLRPLATVAEFFKATGCASSKQMVEMSINDIKNRADTIRYLQNNINDLQSCIGSNLNQQNSVCNELVKTFSSLFDTATEKQHLNATQA